jgi:hypothetical protein
MLASDVWRVKLTAEEITQLVRVTVEQQMFGRQQDSFNIDQMDFLAAAVTSAAYAQRHMQRAARYLSDLALLDAALKLRSVHGLVLEFGVASARTINFIASELQEKVFGFDSFAGLPEAWRPGFPRDVFATSTLPEVRANVELIVGLFDRTLPAFCDSHSSPVSFIHIDCDLYSSTQTILGQLRDRIVPGTILVFDEYFNYPGWELHEFRAFAEFIQASGRSYEYVGLVPSHQQVAVRIVG